MKPRTMPWGPFRGRRITSLPEGYLVQLTTLKNSERWVRVAQNELVRRLLSGHKKKNARATKATRAHN